MKKESNEAREELNRIVENENKPIQLLVVGELKNERIHYEREEEPMALRDG